MGISIRIVLSTCFIGWCYLYGIWLLFLEILLSSFPITIIGSLFVTVLVYIVRLPPPSEALVEEVLGKDLILDADEDENLENSGDFPFKMTVIAHRGCGFDAPENSMSAVRAVQDRGCMAVELDMALTSDGVPVLYHDRTLQRMCDLSGSVSSMTWAELEKIDISVTHPLSYKFPNEQIPRLDDAVEECLSLGMRVFIDIKNNDIRAVTAILDLISKYPELPRRCIFTSFYPNIIYMLRRSIPEVVCALAWRPGVIAFEDYTYSRSVGGPYRRRFDSTWKHMLANIGDSALEWLFHNALFFLLGLSAVIVHKDFLGSGRVRHWRRLGLRCIAWPVNLPAEKKFFAQSLQIAYMTDTLDGEPE